MPPANVTELEPLPAQPTQVKVPEVVKVTGSAFASDLPKAAMTTTSRALIKVAFMILAIFRSPILPNIAAVRTPVDERPNRSGLWHPVKG